MTNNFFIPKADLIGGIQNTPMNTGLGSVSPMTSVNLNSADGVSQSNFKDVMSNLANGLNQEINEPDRLLRSAMAGDSSVDIHDVMTAMAKAEMTVSVATQVTSKVIQAYDKIMQISV